MYSHPITEADLHAYVDGLLPEARRQEIEAYLGQRPAEAQRLAAYREQNATLRTLFNPVLDEALPTRLSGAALRSTHSNPWHWQALAAGLAVAMLSGAMGWTLRGASGGAALLAQNNASEIQVSNLARQAAIAHVVYSPDLRHPVEVGADDEEQLVTWLSKRLGTPVHPPKLGELGYELIGGRLLPGERGPVAQFMYHNSTGQRLTLYVSNDRTGNTETGFRFAQEGPVSVFYWIDGKFGYALSSGGTKAELAKIAELVYRQLEQS